MAAPLPQRAIAETKRAVSFWKFHIIYCLPPILRHITRLADLPLTLGSRSVIHGAALQHGQAIALDYDNVRARIDDGYLG